MSKKTIEPVRCKHCKCDGISVLDVDDVHSAECSGCGASGPWKGTPKEAIAAWNDMNQDWTPASDPPKETGFYLVTHIRYGDSFPIVDKDRYYINTEDNGWASWCNHEGFVIAWQPLPEPYEPEKEAGE